MEAKDRIITARVRLQKDNPFFSYLVMGLNLVEKKEIETCGVDFKGNIFYNPEFINKLDNGTMKTLLAHEVMHVALLHLTRENGRDRKLFNVACDIVINNILVNENFTFNDTRWIIPRNNFLEIGGIKIENIDKKSAEEVYAELDKISKEEKEKLKGFDEHIYAKDSGDGDIGGDDDGKGESNGGVSIKQIEGDWKKRLVEASTFSQMRGKLPKGIGLYVDELLDVKLNWRELLYRYITREIPTDYNWNYPSKKSLATGIYMPSLVKETIDVSVAVDTSGSIGQGELQEFLSEIVGISKAFESLRVNVIFMDTKVNNHYVCENGNIDTILNWEITGGGGTDFTTIYDYVGNEIPNTRLLVFFTDGYAEFPKDEDYKTLWLLTKNGCRDEDIPFGEVVRL